MPALGLMCGGRAAVFFMDFSGGALIIRSARTASCGDVLSGDLESTEVLLMMES